MPTELEQAYRNNVRCMTVRQHQIIQQPGAITDCIYFIEKGLFRLYDDRGGKRLTWGFRMEDDFIMALEELRPDQEIVDGIEALEDGVLWCIPGGLVEDLKERSPQFRFHYIAIFGKECIHARRAAHCYGRRGRSNNYQALCQFVPRLLDRVPIPYLAEFTDIPERVFRHLHSSSICLLLSTKRRRKRKR